MAELGRACCIENESVLPNHRVFMAMYSAGRNRLSFDALAAWRIRFHQLSRRAWNFGSWDEVYVVSLLIRSWKSVREAKIYK